MDLGNASVLAKLSLFSLHTFLFNYRMKTKFAKVMFSQVSVCPQGGGSWSLYQGVLCPGHLCQRAPIGQRPPRQRPPWTETPVDRDPLDRDPRQRPLPSDGNGRAVRILLECIRVFNGNYMVHLMVITIHVFNI